MRRGETTLPGPDGDKHNVQAVRPSDFVNDGAVVAFAEGGTALSAEGARTIAQAAERMRGTKWIIEVRGHASAAETMRDKEKSMRLAFDRALVVAERSATACLGTVAVSARATTSGWFLSPAGRSPLEPARRVVDQREHGARPYAAGRRTAVKARPPPRPAPISAFPPHGPN